MLGIWRVKVSLLIILVILLLRPISTSSPSFHITKLKLTSSFSPSLRPPYLGHYEWQISFPPSDVDIRAVQAKFHQDGLLTIDVKRRCYFWAGAAPVMHYYDSLIIPFSLLPLPPLQAFLSLLPLFLDSSNCFEKEMMMRNQFFFLPPFGFRRRWKKKYYGTLFFFF